MNSRLTRDHRRQRTTENAVRSYGARVFVVAPLVLGALVAGDLSFRTAADDPAPRTVQSLVDELNDPDRTVRTAAERKLYDLGPEVLPHLPASDQLNSPAAQDAVRRLREALERDAAAQSVRPSRVTLSGSFPLSEVAERIATQTENRIRTDELTAALRNQVLSVEWDARAFWEVVEDLEQQTDVSVRFSTTGGASEIVPYADVAEPPIATSNAGAFRIAVHSVRVRPDFTDTTRSILRMQYTVAAEPRLRSLFVRKAASDFSASSQGDRFELLNPHAQLERPVRDRGPVSLSIDFVVPLSMVPEMVDLTGRLEIEVATGQEPIVFRNLEAARNVVRRRGGVTATLDRADFIPNPAGGSASARIDLRVAYDQGGPAFESHRTWVYHNEAFLRTGGESSNGATDRWSHSEFKTLGAEEGAVKLSYRFDDVTSNTDRLEFVYVAPTLLVTVPVEFELRNLPVAKSGR